MPKSTPVVMAIVLVGASCATEPAPPGIAFFPDNYTCWKSSPVDLFVDGTKIGSPTLSFGQVSTTFAVAGGTHVVSAKSLETGAEWPDHQVTAAGPVVDTLVCNATRQLGKFSGTIDNGLVDPARVTIGDVTDTVGAATTRDLKFVGNTGVTWSPLPQRYPDGSVIPDDRLASRDTIVNGRTTQLLPFANGNSFYTFALTNGTGGTLSVGVYGGGALRCLLNLSSASQRYPFGYFYLRPSTEVRAYRGPDCTGAFFSWNYTALLKRNPRSGSIDLLITTPP